ncbi:MAG: DUF3301 domain-containing protein [Rhodocyclaceae bacterium]|nr:DUF3301 domain-containing protein [Rhodocyclaceae bacterium]
MPTLELIGLVVLGALAWLWHDSLKARDAAVLAVRQACELEDLQLLDATVAIASLKPERNEDGRLALRRVYEFEYSDTGDNRRRGSVIMLGQRVLVLNVGLRLVPSGRTLH